MILTCPQCSTRYQADAAKFQPAGRTVRCAKCGHVWHQGPPAADDEAAAHPSADSAQPAEIETAEAEPAAAPAPPVKAAPVAARGLDWQWGAVRGWIIFAALVLAAVLGGVFLRHPIAKAWPQTASLYKAIGLPVNTLGLAFKDVSYRVAVEDDLPVLLVRGRVINVSDHAMSVPPVRVALTNEFKHEVYHWDIHPAAKSLPAGQSVAFRTRLPSPPSGARHLELHFITAGS